MSVDPYGGAAPPAGLYDFSHQITTGIDGVESVRDDDILQFHELGFLVIRGAISQLAIDAARASIRDLILRRDTNNLMIESAASESFDMSWDEDERLNSVRKLMPTVQHDPRLRAVAEDEGMLKVVERIIGETPALTQDMAMIKPPLIGREKPWHQDLAYFNFPKRHNHCRRLDRARPSPAGKRLHDDHSRHSPRRTSRSLDTARLANL